MASSEDRYGIDLPVTTKKIVELYHKITKMTPNLHPIGVSWRTFALFLHTDEEILQELFEEGVSQRFIDTENDYRKGYSFDFLPLATCPTQIVINGQKTGQIVFWDKSEAWQKQDLQKLKLHSLRGGWWFLKDEKGIHKRQIIRDFNQYLECLLHPITEDETLL